VGMGRLVGSNPPASKARERGVGRDPSSSARSNEREREVSWGKPRWCGWAGLAVPRAPCGGMCSFVLGSNVVEGTGAVGAAPPARRRPSSRAWLMRARTSSRTVPASSMATRLASMLTGLPSAAHRLDDADERGLPDGPTTVEEACRQAEEIATGHVRRTRLPAPRFGPFARGWDTFVEPRSTTMEMDAQSTAVRRVMRRAGSTPTRAFAFSWSARRAAVTLRGESGRPRSLKTMTRKAHGQPEPRRAAEGLSRKARKASRARFQGR